MHLLYNNIIRELACTDLVLKDDVQLLESSVHGLREAEPAPYKTASTDGAEQVSCFALPIAFLTAKHIRHTNGKDDAKCRLYSCGYSNGTTTQTCGRDFTDEHKADGTDGHLVGESPDVHKSSLCPNGSTVVLGNIEEADDE
jgi:hypothetical protein